MKSFLVAGPVTVYSAPTFHRPKNVDAVEPCIWVPRRLAKIVTRSTADAGQFTTKAQRKHMPEVIALSNGQVPEVAQLKEVIAIGYVSETHRPVCRS